MDKQRLNRKLAKYFKAPLEDYAQSLDSCFKWLVPKLKHYEINNWVEKSRAWVGNDDREYKVAGAETPALALCRAIEKLINKEVG